MFCFFFSSRRRHTRYWRDWSSDVCSSDLVLHLQPALLPAQLHELVLLGAGLPVDDAVVDVGLAHPAAHRLHRDVEVGGDLGLTQVTAAGDPDDVTLELRRELLGHSDILSAGPRPTEAVSTQAAAVPSDAVGERGGPG